MTAVNVQSDHKFALPIFDPDKSKPFEPLKNNFTKLNDNVRTKQNTAPVAFSHSSRSPLSELNSHEKNVLFKSPDLSSPQSSNEKLLPQASRFTSTPEKPTPSNNYTDSQPQHLKPAPQTKRKKKTHIEYQLLNKIGHGAYGVVYRALNKINNTELAIKIINFDDDEVLTDQMNEIDLLKNLKHENIVKYQGFIQKTHKLYILLEYCSNGSLRDLIKLQTTGCLNETLAKHYVKQTLHGLQYLHDQGVIHRDIKAANLLLDHNNNVKLADFGVSTKVTHIAMTCVGSPNWMAPEILLGQGATIKCDIWSVGATVVEMLTGNPPFFDLSYRDAVCHAVMHETYHIPAKYNLSLNAKNFIKDCLNKNIFKRPTAKFLLENEKWLTEEDKFAQKKKKLKNFKESDDFYKGFGENDFLGSPKKHHGNKHGLETNSARSSTSSYHKFTLSPKKLGNSPLVDGTKSEFQKEHLRYSSSSSVRSISSSSSGFNEDLELESAHALLMENRFFETLLFSNTLCQKVFNDVPHDIICKKVLDICWGNVKDPQNNIQRLFECSLHHPAFHQVFSAVQGYNCLIMYIQSKMKDSEQEKLHQWYQFFMNCYKKEIKYAFHLPQFVEILCFTEQGNVSLTLDLTLHYCKELVHKFGNMFLESLVVARCLPFLFANMENITQNQTQEEQFKHLFLSLTEHYYILQESYLQQLMEEKNWEFTVLKLLNNCSKNNSFVLPHSVFQWLLHSVLPNTIAPKIGILNSEKENENESGKTSTTHKLTYLKTVRYFLEVVYVSTHVNQNYKSFLLGNLQLLEVTQQLIKMNKSYFQQCPDETLTKYYNYVIKYIIRLCSELSSDLNSLDNFNELLFKSYCLIGFSYLENFKSSTYAWCSIEILSNCLPKLYQKNLVHFKPHSIIYKDEVFDTMLMMQNFFDEHIVSSQDCEKTFKKINKLLIACGANSKTADMKPESKALYSNPLFEKSDFVSKDSNEVIVQGNVCINNGYLHGQALDRKEKLGGNFRNIPPFAQLIVDDDKFLVTVEKILDKYKGSLIIQIEFLKFLKTLFHQYVWFRYNEYFYQEVSSTFHESSESKNKKLSSYNLLKTPHLRPKTNNLRQVNEMLLTMWDAEDKAENLSFYGAAKKQEVQTKEPEFDINASPSRSATPMSPLTTQATKNVGQRVGQNSILIKQLVKDINKIYNESITLA
ncbi:hypothetical protein ACO0QE_000224 [Hanseniaspora vineae]